MSPHPRSNRTLWFLAFALLLLLMIWAWWGGSAQATPSTGKPQGDAKDATAAPKAKAPTPPKVEDKTSKEQDSLKEAYLHIRVRTNHRTNHRIVVLKEEFEDIWPQGEPWDEELLHSYNSTNAILKLSKVGTPYRNGYAERVALPPLKEEGLIGRPLSSLNTPEEALLALMAEWVDSSLDYGAQRTAYYEEALQNEEAQRATREPSWKPHHDLESFLQVADLINERWPDHPVAEFALWAQVKGEIAKNPRSPDQADMLNTLQLMHTPALRARVAQEITLYARKPTPELLYEISSIEGNNLVIETAITAWGMHVSTYVGRELSEVAKWSERLDTALQAGCTVSEPEIGLLCDIRTEELFDVKSRLVAFDYQQAETWQQALTAEAWRCLMKGKAQKGLSKTYAIYTDRWTFEPWTRTTGVSQCLSDLEHTSVEPAQPLKVRITLQEE